MRKQITSILLVAGTCIGGGTIALPMVLAKLGIIPSIIITALIWLLTYYTSLTSVELNLQSERGLSLGMLGRKFSGTTAETIGEISVKLLSYALISVYTYGGASIIQKLLEIYLNIGVSSLAIETYIATAMIVLMLFPSKIISEINNVAFLGFVIIFLILTGAMILITDYSLVPWVVEPSCSSIISVISVVFTSFGYQVIFHTLRDYLGKDAKMLRRAFLYGSFTAVTVYMLWTGTCLSVIYKSDPEFFAYIISGKIDVGDLVKELADISQIPNFQTMIWWMSSLAIFTSILGVSIGLTESVNLSLQKTIDKPKRRKFASSLITILPAYVIAAVVPNAFIKVLGFAGAILVVIAILMPIYLFCKADIKKLYLTELAKWPLMLCVAAGIAIIAIEFLGK